MDEKPQSEHGWLQKLVGEWTCESNCKMGPDEPEMRVKERKSFVH